MTLNEIFTEMERSISRNINKIPETDSAVTIILNLEGDGQYRLTVTHTSEYFGAVLDSDRYPAAATISLKSDDFIAAAKGELNADELLSNGATITGDLKKLTQVAGLLV